MSFYNVYYQEDDQRHDMWKIGSAIVDGAHHLRSALALTDLAAHERITGEPGARAVTITRTMDREYDNGVHFSSSGTSSDYVRIMGHIREIGAKKRAELLQAIAAAIYPLINDEMAEICLVETRPEVGTESFS